MLGVLAVIVIIIIVAVSSKKVGMIVNPEAVIPELTKNVATTTAPGEIVPSKSVVTLATSTPEIIKESAPVAYGSSLVTKDNKVITPQGTPVKLNVSPASPDAPTESQPVAVAPSGANTIKVSASGAGFTPNEFTVKEGQLVNFALTSVDDFTHVFRFTDKALAGTLLGVASGETRVKSWNAPKKGTYDFICDIPGHAGRGETGKMIVN